MADRLPEVLRYRAQGLWTFPCWSGTKIAAMEWTELQKRRLTTQEMHAAWPPKGNNNIAVILGPRAHLLALNVNMKHGHNGLRTLNGYTLPPTPTILTPHDGFAYLFQPPDRERYPFLFRTHPAVKDYPGIELRGSGGYQLVPSSHVVATPRDPAGDYRFDAGWTLERLMVDLAPLPAWLLDLWITTDRGAQILTRDNPEYTGKASNSALTKALPAHPPLTPPPQQQKRSQVRPPKTPHQPNRNYLRRACTRVLLC